MLQLISHPKRMDSIKKFEDALKPLALSVSLDLNLIKSKSNHRENGYLYTLEKKQLDLLILGFKQTDHKESNSTVNAEDRIYCRPGAKNELKILLLTLEELGFEQCLYDEATFYFRVNGELVCMATVHVDDIAITGEPDQIQRVFHSQ